MTSVHWQLIFILSLFGLAMAIGTITAIPSNVEPAIWLAVIVVPAAISIMACC